MPMRWLAATAQPRVFAIFTKAGNDRRGGALFLPIDGDVIVTC